MSLIMAYLSFDGLCIFRLCEGGELLDRILSRYSHLMLSRTCAILQRNFWVL